MPASFIQDEEIWNKAKAQADKAKKAPDEYYAYVMSIYKQMGGRIKGKQAESNRKFRPIKVKEAASEASGESKFEVVLLQEGLGNFGDCFYYTKEALESGISVFDGEQLRMNHATANEEDDRPEGDVEKVMGYYGKLEVIEADGGQHELRGVLTVPAGESFDSARDRLQAAIEYAQQFTEKDFIGLSINAAGDAEEQSIDEVIKMAPEACKPKLLEAKEHGIETVRVTKQITAAESCDLVTKAGAGGKVLRLLEAAKEKRKMAKKKENDAPAHDDKDQDKALIKSMLDKHMGDGKHDDGDADEAEKAHQAYQAMGHSKEEAAEMAAKHVKAAKSMKQKKHEGEGEGEGHDAASGDAPGQPQGKGKEKKEGEGEGEDEKKEARVLKLAAENTTLKERVGKLELDLHKDKKLAESKLPRSVTKAFLESVSDVKSVKEFDRQLALFIKLREAAQAGQGDVYADADKEDLATTNAGQGISFADAVEE